MAFILLAACVQPARADDPLCHDAELFSGRLITDICWSCIFPIKVAGVPLGGSGTVPDKATNKILCFCDSDDGLGTFGITISMWVPARIIELVRKPGCSMALGGITLPLADRRMQGTAGKGDLDKGDQAFYHYHSYAFPLLIILDLFVDQNCVADGYFDFDLMFTSELDPTWNLPELAFWTQPEAAVVSNPIIQSACVADAAAASIGKPQDELFWCFGSWSFAYPFSGKDEARGSMPENTSVLSTRVLAAGHRRGMMWTTMGSDALCKGYIDPMMPKSMYRQTMFFPVAETKRAHATGESDYRWGAWRSIPGEGEDAMYVVWRWTDCCTSLLGLP